jgi:peptidyl-prolyl cis-trans isomerase B (cyclophilin B)
MEQQQWPAPPAMAIDAATNYSVSIETNRGTIELELYPQHAPQTVNNFVFLAGEGFYDGVKFHRVIEDFIFKRATRRVRAAAAPVTALPTSARATR